MDIKKSIGDELGKISKEDVRQFQKLFEKIEINAEERLDYYDKYIKQVPFLHCLRFDGIENDKIYFSGMDRDRDYCCFDLPVQVLYDEKFMDSLVEKAEKEKEEFLKRRNAEIKRKEKQQEKIERKEYERLKNKFGG